MAAVYIKKMIKELTTGKRGAVLGCAFIFLAVPAVAQPLPAGSAAETDMAVAPAAGEPQQSEAPPPPPAPAIEAPSPPPEIAPPAPAPIPSDGSGIRDRFGAPDFVRREMDNELWRYDAKSCSVFFFLQHQGVMLELRYTETLPRGMDMAADPVCVASLEERMAKMPGDITGSTAAQP